MIEAIKQIDGYESMSASEIAAYLTTTGVTAVPIDRAELLHLLNMRGMLRKIIGNSADEKWEGTVLNMQNAILAAGTPDQIDGIRLWFSHVTNPSNSKWDTTLVNFAAAFWQMAQTFAGAEGMPSTADFEAIANLGGGWKYAALTAEQVQAALDSEAARIADANRIDAIDALRVRLENEFFSPAIADPSATLESVKAAIAEDLNSAAN